LTPVYRLIRGRYAKKPLDGEGSFRFGGRWSSPGTRLAYTAEHASLAMIEYFVHIEPGSLPKDLVLVTAEVPEKLSRKVISPKHLPANWRRVPAPPTLAVIGDAFVQDAQTAILIVPSALSQAESNWLINPAHPEVSEIRLRPPQKLRYDPRFFNPS
jgi:RES domain-containing protein